MRTDNQDYGSFWFLELLSNSELFGAGRNPDVAFGLEKNPTYLCPKNDSTHTLPPTQIPHDPNSVSPHRALLCQYNMLKNRLHGKYLKMIVINGVRNICGRRWQEIKCCSGRGYWPPQQIKGIPRTPNAPLPSKYKAAALKSGEENLPMLVSVLHTSQEAKTITFSAKTFTVRQK